MNGRQLSTMPFKLATDRFVGEMDHQSDVRISGEIAPRIGGIGPLDSASRNRTRFLLLDVGTIDGPLHEVRRKAELIQMVRVTIRFPIPPAGRSC